MADSQNQWFVNTFRENVYFLSQQKESRLVMCVDRDDDVKDGGFFERLGKTNMVQLTTRFQQTPIVDMDHTRRFVSHVPYVWSTIIDNDDRLRQLADPESNYTLDARYGAGRQIDLVIITALGGTAFSGQDGKTAVTFPSGQRILQAFETNKWFSIVKWIEMKRLLDTNEVRDDDRYIVLRSQDLANLLQPTAISTSLANPLLNIDYSTAKGLVEGTVTRYLGMDVKRSEQVLAGSEGSTFGVTAWQKLAVGFTMPADFETNLAKDPTVNYNWRPHLKISLGAVRKEEEAVVIANCKNTIS